MTPSVATTWHAAEALGASAPELAPFQDEPAQMKSGTVGKTGFLHLGFELRGKQTILADLDRRAPYMAQRALYCDDGVPGLAHVFMITTTGCLLQGDRLALEIVVGPRAQAHVTTQSATKIHTMDANFAAQTQTITLGEESYLELLPDPLIPHRRARYLSDTRICVPEFGDAALFGNHSGGAEASSSGRMLWRHVVIDRCDRLSPGRSATIHRKAAHRPAAVRNAADWCDGLVRCVWQRDLVHA